MDTEIRERAAKRPHRAAEKELPWESELTSELPGFYRLPLAKRRERLGELAELSEEDLRVISGDEGLCAEQANHMVENALGVIGVPLALCVNLRVDGRDCLVPMAVEEASVVAAASHAAKLLRAGGGIDTELTASKMIGQIQLLDVSDPQAAEAAILAERQQLLAAANTCDPCLIRHGGGAVDLVVRHLPARPGDPVGHMLVVHLIVDVRDAMGANTVNSMCEHLAPRIEALAQGRVRLRIISNLADQRVVVATGRVPLLALEGKSATSAEDLARGIEEASVFAERDPYRAATHNKGIMNGVDGVLVAFGQDWRAVEAGAHAYAARDGQYTALASWRVERDALVGRLELPMPVGIVGGVTTVHPTYRVARKLARIQTANDLASITAAVGLAQNLGALRALAAEGIQRGHMRVHARNVAVASGAVAHEVDLVASTIADRGSVSLDTARQVLREVRSELPTPIDAAHVLDRFSALREGHLPRIMELLQDATGEGCGPDSTLVQMCDYHLQTGGKRLRALIPLLVADCLGVEPAALVPFGAACEMLHNATLVHDDLQDGDKLRRGLETIWSRYGAAQAVNLGDAMFYYTLLLIHRLDAPLTRREAVARRALRETLRVIDGQEREFLLKGESKPTLAQYYAMVERKTSGLFALPMAGAAALCGMPPQVVDALQEAARHMGVLFQIQDDILDLHGEKGRDMRGSDLREGKRSIMVVHALQTAAPEQAEWLCEVLDRDREATTAADIDEVVALFTRCGSLQFALREVAERRERAQQMMALLEHQQLVSVVDAMCELFLEPIRPVIARYSVSA